MRYSISFSGWWLVLIASSVGQGVMAANDSLDDLFCIETDDMTGVDCFDFMSTASGQVVGEVCAKIVPLHSNGEPRVELHFTLNEEEELQKIGFWLGTNLESLQLHERSGMPILPHAASAQGSNEVEKYASLAGLNLLDCTTNPTDSTIVYVLARMDTRSDPISSYFVYQSMDQFNENPLFGSLEITLTCQCQASESSSTSTTTTDAGEADNTSEESVSLRQAPPVAANEGSTSTTTRGGGSFNLRQTPSQANNNVADESGFGSAISNSINSFLNFARQSDDDSHLCPSECHPLSILGKREVGSVCFRIKSSGYVEVIYNMPDTSDYSLIDGQVFVGDASTNRPAIMADGTQLDTSTFPIQTGDGLEADIPVWTDDSVTLESLGYTCPDNDQLMLQVMASATILNKANPHVETIAWAFEHEDTSLAKWSAFVDYKLDCSCLSSQDESTTTTTDDSEEEKICVASDDYSGEECYPLTTETNEEYGRVCVSINDELSPTALEVKYEVNDPWALVGTQFWLGFSESALEGMPNGNGAPLKGQFPYQANDLNRVEKWKQDIVLDSLPDCTVPGDKVVVTMVAHAEVMMEFRSGMRTAPQSTFGYEVLGTETGPWFGYFQFELTCSCEQTSPPTKAPTTPAPTTSLEPSAFLPHCGRECHPLALDSSEMDVVGRVCIQTLPTAEVTVKYFMDVPYVIKQATHWIGTDIRDVPTKLDHANNDETLKLDVHNFNYDSGILHVTNFDKNTEKVVNLAQGSLCANTVETDGLALVVSLVVEELDETLHRVGPLLHAYAFEHTHDYELDFTQEWGYISFDLDCTCTMPEPTSAPTMTAVPVHIPATHVPTTLFPTVVAPKLLMPNNIEYQYRCSDAWAYSSTTTATSVCFDGLGFPDTPGWTTGPIVHTQSDYDLDLLADVDGSCAASSTTQVGNVNLMLDADSADISISLERNFWITKCSAYVGTRQIPYNGHSQKTVNPDEFSQVHLEYLVEGSKSDEFTIELTQEGDLYVIVYALICGYYPTL